MTINAVKARELTNKNNDSYKSLISRLDISIQEAIDNGKFYTYLRIRLPKDSYKLQQYYENFGYQVVLDGDKFELKW